MIRGLIVAALHLAIVLSMTARYAWDRDRLPRAWARTVNYDPNLPVRGRYVNLRVVVPLEGDPGNEWMVRARLSIRDHKLMATVDPTGSATLHGQQRIRGALVTPGPISEIEKDWALDKPVAFFLSEHAADPTQRKPGEELWVEVSVPAKGQLRPVRLGVQKDGALTPLELR